MKRLITALIALAMVGCSSSTDTGAPAGAGVDPGPVNMATASRGVTQGGAQDIGRFRAIVEAGDVPAPDTLDPVGYFAEHAIDLPPAECGDAVCIHPYLAVMPTFSDGNWTMAYVGMNTAVDPSLTERPPQHVVVALETSLRTYGWVGNYPNELLEALVGELRPGDKVSLVTFDDQATVQFAGLDYDDVEVTMVRANDPTERETALYDGLALAADTIEMVPHEGASRIVLVTSGHADAGLRGSERVLALGESLARAGISLSVFGVGGDYLEDVPATLGSMGAGTYSYAADDADLRTLFAIEGRTSFSPLVSDFELRVVAADGYAVGDIYGARSASATQAEAYLASPVLMVGNRTGSSDVSEGRRGGGGGLFVRLYAGPDSLIGPNAPAFTIVASWTDSVTGERVEREQVVTNALAPGQNPEGMWPSFSDEALGKAFMMLNMYLATRASVELFHSGDCATSLGVQPMMNMSYGGWQAVHYDVDLEADWALLGDVTSNVREACISLHTTAPEPVWPQNESLGCGFL